MATLNQIFNSFKVSAKDLKLYKKILKGTTPNREQKVIDHFMKKYVYRLNTVFSKAIKAVFVDLISVDTTAKQFTKSAIGFKVTSKKYKEILKDSYKKIAPLITDSFFKKNNIKNIQLQNKLKKEVFQEFENYIKDAMSLTDKNIIKDIRTIQREVIQNTLKIRKLKDIPDFTEYIAKTEKEFKDVILKKYPGIRQKIEDGKVLKSRPWRDKSGNIRNMTYRLDTYTDFAIENTIMNLESITGTIEAEQSGDRVVEYYLANDRKLKTVPFPYCQEVLRKKIKGKALLALDEGAADILGIDSVSTARAKWAMDRKRHCRHATRKIKDENYLKTIDKLLYAGSLSFAAKEG